MMYTKDEFITFLLLYAAHADAEFTQEEKDMILDHANGETYQKIYDDFVDKNDYQAIQTILSYRDKYFPSEEAKTELLSDVKDMFCADGEFSSFEREILHLLQRLM